MNGSWNIIYIANAPKYLEILARGRQNKWSILVDIHLLENHETTIADVWQKEG